MYRYRKDFPFGTFPHFLYFCVFLVGYNKLKHTIGEGGGGGIDIIYDGK